ncbi:hypothetical protein BDY21DRAFT_18832 [Lineolata rhizophorae]|uniref:Uncharacterized protein n=1 Tax=Lineolata rhizophorae TaxID=578093 RepID=A0A6A6P1X4_9PEZI|nr:hypothetical protein BDY21DRAFT_18832 [Lineolata rhizophorae]
MNMVLTITSSPTPPPSSNAPPLPVDYRLRFLPVAPVLDPLPSIPNHNPRTFEPERAPRLPRKFVSDKLLADRIKQWKRRRPANVVQTAAKKEEPKKKEHKKEELKKQEHNDLFPCVPNHNPETFEPEPPRLGGRKTVSDGLLAYKIEYWKRRRGANEILIPPTKEEHDDKKENNVGYSDELLAFRIELWKRSRMDISTTSKEAERSNRKLKKKQEVRKRTSQDAEAKLRTSTTKRNVECGFSKPAPVSTLRTGVTLELIRDLNNVFRTHTLSPPPNKKAKRNCAKPKETNGSRVASRRPNAKLAPEGNGAASGDSSYLAKQGNEDNSPVRNDDAKGSRSGRKGTTTESIKYVNPQSDTDVFRESPKINASDNAIQSFPHETLSIDEVIPARFDVRSTLYSAMQSMSPIASYPRLATGISVTLLSSFLVIILAYLTTSLWGPDSWKLAV